MKIEDIEGQEIEEVRHMTEKEMDGEGWFMDVHGPPLLLVLNNGVKIFPSQDEEGNGAGQLFLREASK